MKKIYTVPELSVLSISSADIMTMSGGLLSLDITDENSIGHAMGFNDFNIF